MPNMQYPKQLIKNDKEETIGPAIACAGCSFRLTLRCHLRSTLSTVNTATRGHSAQIQLLSSNCRWHIPCLHGTDREDENSSSPSRCRLIWLSLRVSAYFLRPGKPRILRSTAKAGGLMESDLPLLPPMVFLTS